MEILSLTSDAPVSAEGGSALPPTWDSDMLVLAPSGVCEALYKTGIMSVLPDYGL